MMKDTENIFWLEPLAGLGNRMQVMASAWYFAQKYDKQLCILWSNDFRLGADFQDLFEAIPDIRIISVTTEGYRKRPFLRYKSERLRKKLTAHCDYATHVNQWGEKTTEELYEMIDTHLRDAKDVFISSWKTFVPLYDNNEISIDFLSPSKEVCLRGEALFLKIKPNTIGVHIRRTDHEEAIAGSPLSAFIVRMQAEVEKDAATNFYVATDEQSVELEMRKQFGERVFFYESKSWGRDNKAGMIDACVELWALSKCKMIIGSKGSTFGMIAAKMGAAALEIAENDSL